MTSQEPSAQALSIAEIKAFVEHGCCDFVGGATERPNCDCWSCQAHRILRALVSATEELRKERDALRGFTKITEHKCDVNCITEGCQSPLLKDRAEAAEQRIKELEQHLIERNGLAREWQLMAEKHSARAIEAEQHIATLEAQVKQLREAALSTIPAEPAPKESDAQS